jgi:Dynamin family
MGRVAETIGTSFQSGMGASERFAVTLGALCQDLSITAAGRSPMLVRTIRALRRTEAALRRPLRLGVIGESNSGKSTLTNLLLGVTMLPTLQIANTRVPTLIRYGEKPSAICVLQSGKVEPLAANTRPPGAIRAVEVQLPLAPLRACEIIDFPGFSDPLLGYDDVDIDRYRVDVAVWCTFSTQAWKESERAAWLRLPSRTRQCGILAVTNMDRLKGDQAAKVLARLEKVARSDFRDFVFLSSLKAQHAFNSEGVVTNHDNWQASGAAALHHSIRKLLRDRRLDRLRKAQALTRRMTEQALQRLST